MRSLIRAFDSSVTHYVTSMPGFLKPFFITITMLGDPIAVIGIGFIIACFGYVQDNIRLLISGVIVWLTLGIGAFMKILIARERPLVEHMVNLRIDTFSFPSGHSSGSMVAYGLLAYIAYQLLPAPWNLVFCLALSLVPLLVGVSRIYLGVHYPSDVVAGWLLGLVALAVIIFIVQPLGAR